MRDLGLFISVVSAESSGAKEKIRFARKYSLVENRLWAFTANFLSAREQICLVENIINIFKGKLVKTVEVYVI